VAERRLPTWEVHLHRLDVARNRRKPETPTWTLTLHNAPSFDEPILIGLLSGSVGSVFGQALAAATFSNTSTFDSLEDEDDWLTAGPGEAIYDTCRRALDSAAAQMDQRFEFTRASPRNGITRRDISPAPSTPRRVRKK
jgi:hypothetical protein